MNINRRLHWMKCIPFLIAGCGNNATTSSSDAAGLVDAASATDAAATANEVTGKVEGAPFAAANAMYVDSDATGFDIDNGMVTVIAINDYANGCAAETANMGVPNGGSILIGAAIVDAQGKSTPATATGSYTVVNSPVPAGGGKLAQVFFQRNDSHCLPAQKLLKSTGTVTITRADPSPDGVAGTFDVTFSDSGEHVTGKFTAANCPGFNPNRTATGGCN